MSTQVDELSIVFIQKKFKIVYRECFHFVFSADFLGRTEVSLAKLVARGKGPWHERLLLHEVETGEVVVKIELQLT